LLISGFWLVEAVPFESHLIDALLVIYFYPKDDNRDVQLMPLGFVIIMNSFLNMCLRWRATSSVRGCGKEWIRFACWRIW